MNQNKFFQIALRQTFLPVLYICLAITLFSQPVRSSVSYITSLSVTCVNTFTCEGQIKPDPSAKPTDPVDPSTPVTGDDGLLKKYALGMSISLAVFAATLKLGHKKILHK